MWKLGNEGHVLAGQLFLAPLTIRTLRLQKFKVKAAVSLCLKNLPNIWILLAGVQPNVYGHF